MIEGTIAAEKIHKQSKQIYEVLCKYGFPGLVSAKVAQTASEIQSQLSDYFQPNIKRQNLIQWLILNINPLYTSDLQQKNKKKTIMNHLWQLGVMPFNKHTGNLDYEKYVEGLLGHENAVELIYNLCLLVKAVNVYSKAKDDKKFKQFYEEIMANYDSLVNVDYDPYKISFPPAYQHIPEEQFEQEFQNTIAALKNMQSNNEIPSQESCNYDQIFKKYEQNRAHFQQRYSVLVESIKEVISKNQVMISSCKDVESFSGRTLSISPNLSKVYRRYKEKIRISKVAASRLKQERVRIQSLIQEINDVVCI